MIDLCVLLIAGLILLLSGLGLGALLHDRAARQLFDALETRRIGKLKALLSMAVDIVEYYAPDEPLKAEFLDEARNAIGCRTDGDA